MLSILFVVWDHFKDDRLLTKRVKAFYKNIEDLVYSYYVMKLSQEKFSKNCENNAIEDFYFKFKKDNVFFRGIINQTFEDYSKYIGLTYYNKPSSYCVRNYNFLIDSTGAFYKLVSKLPQSEIGTEYCFYDNQLKRVVISKENIEIINQFFKILRDHWKKYYYKFIFRKKLKPKVDFSKLLDYN